MDAYYTLRRSQVDQVAIERAREESATRLVAERAAWESERTALLARQSQLQKVAAEKEQWAVEMEQWAAEKERVAEEKERELGEIAEMMQSALELHMEAELELKVRKEQVYKL